MPTDDLLAEAHLRYVSDKQPGIKRVRTGPKSFTYLGPDKKPIEDKDTLDRIKKLVLPPAWEKVWISPHINGHLQATGYDSKGRKQYRYHDLWTELSQEHKFLHLLDFARSLPRIRRRIRKDLNLPGLPREKVIATAVWLLQNTLIRVGNEAYVLQNKSYGLTTLTRQQVDVEGDMVKFEFKGKSGVYHKLRIHSKKVADIIRRCKEIPGQELFEYLDENGNYQMIHSHDVNNYLKEVTGRDITAKDFRTWGGTLLAAELLDQIGIVRKRTESNKNVIDAVKKVAAHLRNKPDTCKKYYISPIITNAYEKGYTLSNLQKSAKFKKIKSIRELDDFENQLVCMLSMFTEEA
ncbi:MAG: DNA topoisomerase IB [Candidatus Curtissbacteria bacterium]|nr:DNA topoisomerase IB [Candidatus Curtissbacteria bacterium]